MSLPIYIPIASVEQLKKLEHVGTKKASAILNYRNEVSQFPTVEELVEVTGIQQDVWQSWIDSEKICLSLSPRLSEDPDNVQLLIDKLLKVHDDMIDQFQAKCSLEKRMAELEASNDQQVSLLSEECAELTAKYNKSLETSQTESDDLKSQIKELTQQLQALKARCKQNQETHEEVRSELEHRIRSLQQDRKVDMAEMSSLADKIDELQQNLAWERRDREVRKSQSVDSSKGEESKLDKGVKTPELPFIEKVSQVIESHQRKAPPAPTRQYPVGTYAMSFSQEGHNPGAETFAGNPFRPSYREDSQTAFRTNPYVPGNGFHRGRGHSRLYSSGLRGNMSDESYQEGHHESAHRKTVDTDVARAESRNVNREKSPGDQVERRKSLSTKHSAKSPKLKKKLSHKFKDDSTDTEMSDADSGRKSRRKSFKKYNTSDSETSSSESDSESDSDYDRRKRRRRHSRSPQRPKMQIFTGDDKTAWEPFLFQFERLAERRQWKTSKKLDRLIDCLGGTALEYANKLHIGHDYKQLKRELKHRFSKKDAPVSARRRLAFSKQKEDESLEEFSQRVHFLTLDAYPTAGKKTVQQISVETFLRGCRDKESARSAMEKEPKDMYKALKYVKASMANNKAIFGSRSYGYGQRQVSFADTDVSHDEEVYENRRVNQTSKPKDFSRVRGSSSISGDIAHLTDIMSNVLSTLVKERSSRSRSPTPPRSMANVECYKCRKKGHMQNTCPEKFTLSAGEDPDKPEIAGANQSSPKVKGLGPAANP